MLNHRIALCVAASILVGGTSACSGDASAPGGGDEVAGFRIVEGSTTRFQYIEGDHPAGDTLFIQSGESMTVDIRWLDADGDVTSVSDDAELEVFISNSGAAEWLPDASEPFSGTFDTGPFDEVEAGMRIRLLEEGDTLFASPLLQLHVL